MLVLDDYHLITNPQIQESVAAFVDHLPRVLELALATRSAPALPLARLRARGELVEVDAADLSFSSRGHGVAAQRPARARVGPRRRGRAPGAHRGLGGRSLPRLAHPPGSRAAYAEEFVREFAGDDRHVVDYLSAEVLGGQPAEARLPAADLAARPLLRAAVRCGHRGRRSRRILREMESVELLPHPARQQARLVPLPPPVRGAAPPGAGAHRAREQWRAASPGKSAWHRDHGPPRRPSVTPRRQATSRTRRR